jgi:hypothetical protein
MHIAMLGTCGHVTTDACFNHTKTLSLLNCTTQTRNAARPTTSKVLQLLGIVVARLSQAMQRHEHAQQFKRLVYMPL